MRGVDALGSEMLPHRTSREIVPECGDQRHLAAQTRRGDGLIGPLTAERLHETGVSDRLSGTGHPLRDRNQVHIGASYDNYFHCFLFLRG